MSDSGREARIPRLDPGEVAGPFSVVIPASSFRYLRWKAALPGWRRAFEWTPLRGWLLRREIRRDPQAFAESYFRD